MFLDRRKEGQKYWTMCSKHFMNLVCSCFLHECNFCYCVYQMFALCHIFKRFVSYLYVISSCSSVKRHDNILKFHHVYLYANFLVACNRASLAWAKNALYTHPCQYVIFFLGGKQPAWLGHNYAVVGTCCCCCESCCYSCCHRSSHSCYFFALPLLGWTPLLMVMLWHTVHHPGIRRTMSVSEGLNHPWG
jgi:hypothetical protein